MRIGTVTDAGPPLEITVGGSSSDTPYRPHALASASFSNGDQVAVLVQGNDMLVLGVIA